MLEGIQQLVPRLSENSWLEAATAIMTTDTVAKGVSSTCVIDGEKITITGIAKGSGMIHPNMATMLSFVATDAAVDPFSLRQRALHIRSGMYLPELLRMYQSSLLSPSSEMVKALPDL